MSKIPLISIIGASKSGKTTLLEKLIPELKRRGYRVATIKHHFHPGFEIDQPGKDTWRHAQAGSDQVIISAPDKIASIKHLEKELSLDDIVAQIEDVDIILTEGYKSAGKPSIEVLRQEIGLEHIADESQLIAIASDVAVPSSLPVFDINNPNPIVDFIEQRYLRQSGSSDEDNQ